MKEAKVDNMETTSNVPASSTDLAKMPPVSIEVKNIDLDMEEIRNWIAPQGATAKEIYTFGRICQTLGLNPFKKEIYFIKYGNMDASIVVGYTVYIDRAERSGKLDGWSVRMDDNQAPTEATITIHRKDWTHPFEWTVYLDDVIKLKKDGTPQSTWATQLRFQLRKCTISQGFRLAFPSECADLPYTAEEIDQTRGYLPDIPELSEATIESAREEPDIDYLRGQYFKWATNMFGKEGTDARHNWQQTVIGKASVKDWTVEDFQKALDVIDEITEEEGMGTAAREIEKERLESELGQDDATQEVPFHDGSEIEMDKLDDIETEMLAEKRKHIVELVGETPIETVDSVKFTTWRDQILEEEKGVPFDELTLDDLNIIIGELEARADNAADEAAEDKGMLC